MYETQHEPKRCQSADASVYMAGEIAHAKQIIRTWCKSHPSCVTVVSTTFIYSGGEESGFIVSFRNYPRFPSSRASLLEKSRLLASELLERLGQDSYMIVCGDLTEWHTERPS